MCECGETLPESLTCACGNHFEASPSGLQKVMAAKLTSVR
jgi:hypothetical protein